MLFRSTLEAGAGLCDESAVRTLVTEAPVAIRYLMRLGASFDPGSDGSVALTREGGHSHNRIVHAGGDQSGAAKRITDLETAWDDDQADLQPADCATWNVLDHEIDDVLSSVRASRPKASVEESAMDTLLTTLP